MSNSVTMNFSRILDSFNSSDYHGLKNQGATCYLNSVLQVLFMTKDFREAVKRHCGQDSSTIDPYLTRLFNDLEMRTADARHITKKLGIAKIYEQRDAAEYFERILNMTSPEASQIFKGLLRHRTTCSKCQRQSDAEGPFWTLPLSMEEYCSQAYSVRNGFEEFFRPADISGDNRLYCDRCNAKTDATVGCEIKHHPEILTLLLKRFEFDYHRMHYVKNNSCADVPKTLQTEDGTYYLYALVNHFGSLKGGHVTATIKSYQTGEWYNFDDTRVTLVKTPLFEASDNKTRSSCAYLLMYRKVPAPGSKIINGAIHEPHFEKAEAMGEEKEDTVESGEGHLSHDHLKDDSNYAKKSPKRTCNKSKERRDDIKARKGHGGESIRRDLEEKQHLFGYEVVEQAMLREEMLPHRDSIMAGLPDRQEKWLGLERHNYKTENDITRRNDTSMKKTQEVKVAKPGQNKEEIVNKEHQTDYPKRHKRDLLNMDIYHLHSNENPEKLYQQHDPRDNMSKQDSYSQVNTARSKEMPTMARERQHENVAKSGKMDSAARCIVHSTVMNNNNNDGEPAGNHMKNKRDGVAETSKRDKLIGQRGVADGMGQPRDIYVINSCHAFSQSSRSEVPRLTRDTQNRHAVKQKPAICQHMHAVKPPNFERDKRNLGTGTSQGKGKNAEQNRVKEKRPPWR